MLLYPSICSESFHRKTISANTIGKSSIGCFPMSADSWGVLQKPFFVPTSFLELQIFALQYTLLYVSITNLTRFCPCLQSVNLENVCVAEQHIHSWPVEDHSRNSTKLLNPNVAFFHTMWKLLHSNSNIKQSKLMSLGIYKYIRFRNKWLYAQVCTANDTLFAVRTPPCQLLLGHKFKKQTHIMKERRYSGVQTWTLIANHHKWYRAN